MRVIFVRALSIVALAPAFLGSGCAVLHMAGVGEIDTSRGRGARIDLKASEIGFDIKGTTRAATDMTRRHGNKNVKGGGNIFRTVVDLTNMAPQVGNPTVTDTWADNITEELRGKCTNGQVTNIAFIRETAKYPAVSGEIVRVVGECFQASKGR